MKRQWPIPRHGHCVNTFRWKKSSEYGAWQNMIARCYSPKNIWYCNYGGRGITVCKEWREDFVPFITHVGMKPDPSYTLDRINNDGNYEPGNVRWASRKVQTANRRPVGTYLTFNGQTKSLKEWSKISGVPACQIRYRLKKGWHPSAAAFMSTEWYEVRMKEKVGKVEVTL